MKLVFGTLWEAHLSGDVEFKQLLKNVIDKLVERPSKGDRKGKPGKAGKLTASATNLRNAWYYVRILDGM